MRAVGLRGDSVVSSVVFSGSLWVGRGVTFRLKGWLMMEVAGRGVYISGGGTVITTVVFPMMVEFGHSVIA